MINVTLKKRAPLCEAVQVFYLSDEKSQRHLLVKPGYAGRQTKRTQPESHASSVSTTFAYLAISLPLLFMLKCGSYSKRALKCNAVRPLLQLESHICSPACAPSLVVIRGDTMCSGSGYQRTRRGDWSGSCFCSKSTSSDLKNRPGLISLFAVNTSQMTASWAWLWVARCSWSPVLSPHCGSTQSQRNPWRAHRMRWVCCVSWGITCCWTLPDL